MTADEIFSQSWITAFREAISRSEAYRSAAKNWTWPLVLMIDKGSDFPEERAIYLDLHRGDCREARLATAADLQNVPFVIRATAEAWQQVLAGQIDPMLALVRGKLKLERGSMIQLARHVNAAKQLVRCAASVPAVFPRSQSVQSPQLPETAPEAAATASAGPVFVTTSPGGLDQQSFPMKLYHKAKRFGIWNPQDIDLTQDREDWQRMSAEEREVILHLTALFQAGEESVTRDLLPLIMVIAGEGRLEEELYLTTFLWEEAKHTEFFRRFLDEVAADHSDLSRFHGESYRKIFYRALPEAMNALLTDSSPAAQARAAVTYNMIVEGTLAETGYQAYHAALARNNLLPGIREGITYLKRDESRHIAYGLYLLSRLVHHHPALWQEVESLMSNLLQTALEVIHEIFDTYPQMPFGLKPDDFIEFAMNQFNHRMDRLERARQHFSEASPEAWLPS